MLDDCPVLTAGANADYTFCGESGFNTGIPGASYVNVCVCIYKQLVPRSAPVRTEDYKPASKTLLSFLCLEKELSRSRSKRDSSARSFQYKKGNVHVKKTHLMCSYE